MAKEEIKTFLGPQLGLTISGDRAYAYSGAIDATTAPLLALDFVTGDYVFHGVLIFNGPIRASAAGGGMDAATCQVNFNGQVIALMKTQTQNAYFLGQDDIDIIIPARTHVEVFTEASDASTVNLITCILTGRIYKP